MAAARKSREVLQIAPLPVGFASAQVSEDGVGFQGNCAAIRFDGRKRLSLLDGCVPPAEQCPIVPFAQRFLVGDGRADTSEDQRAEHDDHRLQGQARILPPRALPSEPFTVRRGLNWLPWIL